MHIRCPPHSERLGDNDYMMLGQGQTIDERVALASALLAAGVPRRNQQRLLLFADATGASPWLSPFPSLNSNAPIRTFPSRAESLSPNLSIRPVTDEEEIPRQFPAAAAPGGKVSPPFHGTCTRNTVTHSPLLGEDHSMTGQQESPKRLEEPSALDRQRTYQRQKVEASLRNKPNLPLHIQEKVMAMIMKRGGGKSPSEETLEVSSTEMEGAASSTLKLPNGTKEEQCEGETPVRDVLAEVPGIWNGTEGTNANDKTNDTTTVRLDESSCAMRKRANFEQMDHAMTALSRWNRNTALFRPQKVLMPKDFEPSRFSVLLGHRKEFRLSPGNIHLRSLCETYKAKYDTSDREGKSDIVSTILTSIYQHCPVGAFLRFKDGRYYEVEDLLARDKIASDLRSMLPGKYRSSQKRRSQTTISSKAVGGAAGDEQAAVEVQHQTPP